MQKLKKQKGITLIALVITIIVMLILVGVSVTVALNGGLFSTAQGAARTTEAEKELALSNGDIIDKYLSGTAGGSGGSGGTITLPTGWSVTEAKPTGWSNNVIAITDGTNTIPLPNGFEISTKETEDSIDEGLVLKDGANEFVWIPVEDYETYTEDSFGPLEGMIWDDVLDMESDVAYDLQQGLNHFYGMREDGTTPYYNYSDFTYAMDKTNVENNIKTYGGFT